MKKRHLIYAFLAGLLLPSAICFRIMKETVLYVENSKVVEQGATHAVIMYYHNNTDRYYMVRVPAVDLRNDFVEVTATLWYPKGHINSDALFGEPCLDLAKDMFASNPTWGLRDDELQRQDR